MPFPPQVLKEFPISISISITNGIRRKNLKLEKLIEIERDRELLILISTLLVRPVEVGH